jgi:hypothetical protein
MSELDTLDQSSDYGMSSHYSSSSSFSAITKGDGFETFQENRSGLRPVSPDQDEAARSFAIAGISISSAFILKVFLSRVDRVPSSSFQSDSSHEGGKGTALVV